MVGWRAANPTYLDIRNSRIKKNLTRNIIENEVSPLFCSRRMLFFHGGNREPSKNPDITIILCIFAGSLRQGKTRPSICLGGHCYSSGPFALHLEIATRRLWFFNPLAFDQNHVYQVISFIWIFWITKKAISKKESKESMAKSILGTLFTGWRWLP